MTKARSVIMIILAIFALYIVMNSPTQSADIMRAGLSGIGEILGSFGTFFNQLFKG